MTELEAYKEHIRRQFVCRFISTRTVNKELDKITLNEALCVLSEVTLDRNVTPAWFSVSKELRKYHKDNNSATLNDWLKESDVNVN